MCGITGVFAPEWEASQVEKTVRLMTQAMAHRGPDGEGICVRSPVGLGHRRLSIIDLEGGAQPLSTRDGRFTIVFNGEIYNYRELRADLIQAGEVFQTDSDTEVLLRGFIREKETFLRKLEGFFAFLILDTVSKSLYAARDGYGIKPLYIGKEGKSLFLASEIKALQSVLSHPQKIDPQSLQSYFLVGYSLGFSTLLKGISRLRPGFLWRVNMAGEVSETRFHFPLPSLETSKPTSSKEMRSCLIEAVEKSLVSDVPVGLYLSGGIDSSLIAAIVRRELDLKLESFSVGFPGEPSHDEAPYAQAVATALELPHETISVRPEDFSDLSTLARTLEEPMADPSAMALGRLSELASKKLKVVLSGEGGDELFGGYHRYFWDRWVGRYETFPERLQQAFEWLGVNFGGDRMKRRVGKLRDTLNLPRPVRYASWFSPFLMRDRKELLLKSPEENLSRRYFSKLFQESQSLPGTTQVQWMDLVTFLQDDLLVKADKMSMKNGLEVRPPFLQPKVVEAALGLSENQRVRARTTKPFLREMLRSYLPKSIVDRSKQGFEVPLDKWFRTSYRHLLEEYLSQDAVAQRGLLQWHVVARIRKEHESQQYNHGLALFSLCLLEAWSREFLD